MAKKIELASPEWLEALKTMIARYMKAAGPDLELSICEVFTNAPDHLAKNGDGVIAWHCKIANGNLEFAEGEIDNADLKTIADYQFILPYARMKISPDNMAEYERNQAEGVRLGKLKRSGDRSKVPPAFYGMHNELSEITA